MRTAALALVAAAALAACKDKPHGLPADFTPPPPPAFDAARPVDAPAPPALPAAQVTETPIVGGVTAVVGSLRVSPDGARTVFAAHAAGGQRAVVDGAEHAVYREIVADSLMFSDDSAHLAYAAFQGRGALVVKDGAPGPIHDGVARGTVRLSADGRHLAYGAQDGGAVWMLQDGERRGGPYEDIMSGAPWFARDTLVWAAREHEGAWLYVVDGKRGPVWEGATPLRLSPDGKRWIYAGSRGGRQEVVSGPVGRHTVVERDLDALEAQGPVFSADSAHHAWVAQRGGESIVVLDDREGAHAPWAGGLALGNDGRLAYVVGHDNRQGVVDRGREDLHDGIAGVTMTPDGKHLAYAARDQATWRVIVDGVAGPSFAEVAEDGIILAGDHVLYGARDGDTWVVVRDGQIVDRGGGLLAGALALDATGEHAAWAMMTDGRIRVIGDGAAGPAYEVVVFPPGGLAFAADGALRYVGGRGYDEWRVIQRR